MEVGDVDSQGETPLTPSGGSPTSLHLVLQDPSGRYDRCHYLCFPGEESKQI